MEKTAHEWNQNQVFGMVFLLAQRWQNLGDQALKDSDLTTKQWLLLVSLHALFETPPSLNELTEAMGSSRQNVKQLALQLEKRGFVEISVDPGDARVQRFSLTALNQQFWDARVERDKEFINDLFKGVSAADLDTTRRTIEKLLNSTGVTQ